MVEVGCVEARARAGKVRSCQRRDVRFVASTTIGGRLRCPGMAAGMREHPRDPVDNQLRPRLRLSLLSRGGPRALSRRSEPQVRSREERDGARGGRRCHRIRGPRGHRPDPDKLEVRSPFPSTRSRPPPPRSRRRASEPRGTREQRAARSSSLDSALVSLESPSSLTLAPSSPLTPHPSAKVGTKFTLVLAPTLSLNGTPEDTSFDQSGEESLADAYEYVITGRFSRRRTPMRGESPKPP